MLSKMITPLRVSTRATMQSMKSAGALVNVSRRAFAAENKDLQEQSNQLTQQVVAKDEKPLYELQAYQHNALKAYFD